MERLWNLSDLIFGKSKHKTPKKKIVWNIDKGYYDAKIVKNIGVIEHYSDKKKEWRWRLFTSDKKTIIATSHDSFKTLKESQAQWKLVKGLIVTKRIKKL